MTRRARRSRQRSPLAVIGIGCRYPGTHGPTEFWQSLHEGREEITDTPCYRAPLHAAGDPRDTRPGVSRRGSIGEVSGFDWRAFRMSPRECRFTDPQHRLLLETAWEALEDAGLPLEHVAGTRTAVFVGVMWPDYAKLLAQSAEQVAGYATAGVGFALAANRISHFFDLRGPSVALDVQCASSLTAVHLAAATIWAGEADLALAGGVNLILTPDSDFMMSRAGILSKRGRIATFDTDADGFVRGEGAGIVVLKPLPQALADGDRVLAVLHGSAANHDGRTAALTAPSKDSQVDLIGAACRSAQTSPAALGYIELHGTGTQKGDPLEAQAVGELIGVRRPHSHPCLVGSLKPNIGHCEAAAGVASLIKTVLCLHHEEIPPTINHRHTNPNIDTKDLGIRLVTRLTPWPRGRTKRLAGVTGLSLGGGNAHIVLGEAPLPPVLATVPANCERHTGSWHASPLLLAISARTATALKHLASDYVAFLRTPQAVGQIHDICYTAALRRTHHEFRTVAAASTPQALADQLERFADDARQTDTQLSSAESEPPAVLFAFGEANDTASSPWPAMDVANPLLKDSHLRITAALADSGLVIGQLDGTRLAAAQAFTLQAALADYWQRSGIEPSALVGEGTGALLAAYLAGATTLLECADALRRGSDSCTAGIMPDMFASDRAHSVLARSVDGVSATLRGLGGARPAIVLSLAPPACASALLSEVHAAMPSATLLEPSRALWRTACDLYSFGLPLNWESLIEAHGTVVPLPLYHWDRERLWADPQGAPSASLTAPETLPV